jgi:hypothetical protein
MLKNKKELVMIIRKNYNKENKNEVRGREEEGCLGINK